MNPKIRNWTVVFARKKKAGAHKEGSRGSKNLQQEYLEEYYSDKESDTTSDRDSGNNNNEH